MSHNTEILEVSHVTDTQIAVKIRCCGDDSTASCHTIEVSTDHTDAQIQEWLDGRHAHVQELHNRREKAKATIERLKARG
jgi:hypothetical protein